MKMSLIAGVAALTVTSAAMASGIQVAQIDARGAEAAPAATGRTASVAVRRELVSTGLTNPLYVTHAPGDTSRIFVVEQRAGSVGRIRIIDLATDDLLPTPFLSISPVSTASEQGLLGLAFHPDYDNNGFFYVYYTNAGGATVISRFSVTGDPNIADPGSEQIVLTFSQPFANHNGGWIGFGPDGYLYIASGDGGSGGDPGNRAQNINNLLGKMLRIDVDGDDFPGSSTQNYAIPADNPFVGIAGLNEIWAYGLRNPWRNSFDRETGDLFIADVGQNNWEEINFQAASSDGGENYGWRCYEGNTPFNTGGCPPPAELVFPFHVYSISGFSNPNCSITGGYVYRGCAMPDLRGAYFFGDFCSGFVWSLEYDGENVSNFVNRTSQLTPSGQSTQQWISSFGEDAKGELYICYLFTGQVWRIVPDTDCPEDLSGDGSIGSADLAILLGSWGSTCSPADFSGDGLVGSADLAILLGNWGPCP